AARAGGVVEDVGLHPARHPQHERRVAEKLPDLGGGDDPGGLGSAGGPGERGIRGHGWLLPLVTGVANELVQSSRCADAPGACREFSEIASKRPWQWHLEGLLFLRPGPTWGGSGCNSCHL